MLSFKLKVCQTKLVGRRLFNRVLFKPSVYVRYEHLLRERLNERHVIANSLFSAGPSPFRVCQSITQSRKRATGFLVTGAFFAVRGAPLSPTEKERAKFFQVHNESSVVTGKSY